MQLVPMLKQLIKFQTTTGNTKEISRALSWIKKQIPKGFSTRTYTSQGVTSLYASPHKNLAPDLLLAAHIDVVPGKPNQFLPVVKNNKLFGRGAYDMKFAIACFLRVLQKNKEMLHKKNIGILITSDEEIGGRNGAAYMRSLGLKPKVVFLPDAGPDWTLERHAKGVLHLEITTKGKSTHGSTPWKGKNAAQELIALLSALQSHFSNMENSSSTMSIGKIHAGDSTNKVPDSAVAHIDFRFSNDRGLKKIQLLVRKLASIHRARVTVLASGKPHILPRSHPAVKLLREVIKKEVRKSIKFSVSHGGSDARFFATQKTPVLLCTPTGGGHHTDNEWIDLQELKAYERVLKAFVLQLLD